MWQTGFLDGKVLVIAATQCRSYYSVHTTKPARISFSSMLMKHKRFWLLLMLYTAMLRLRQARSYSSIISNAVHSSEVCSDIRMRKTFRVNNNEKSYWTRRVSTSSLLSKFQLASLARTILSLQQASLPWEKSPSFWPLMTRPVNWSPFWARPLTLVKMTPKEELMSRM